MMRRARAVGGGITFIVANCSSLLLNYFHQAQAASLLSPEAYGRFNVWLGVVGIGGSLSLLAQFAANFVVFSSKTFAYWRAGMALLSSCLLLFHFFGPEAPPTSLLAAEVILFGALVYVSTGQYQARLQFGPMALASAMPFAVRALIPNIVSHPTERIFYLATPIAVLSTLIALAPIGGGEASAPSQPTNTGVSSLKAKLGAALVLAVCGSSFPVIDVLWIAAIGPAETAGRFAQIVLFTRIPYQLGALVLQITLPYHVRQIRGDTVSPHAPLIHKLEIATVAAAAACAPVCAVAVPWVSRWLLGIDLGGQSLLVLISSLGFAALLLLFRGVQLACSRGLLRIPLFVLTAVLGALFFAYLSSGGAATTYLISAVVVYTAAAFGVHVLLTRKMAAEG